MLDTPTLDAVTAPSIVPSHSVQRKVDRPGFYRPELDALRCTAFLAVFMHHAMYVSAPIISRMGAFGLCLFFLLSAFLITELLQREKGLTGTINIQAFYIRRALRIWPLYYGFVVFTVLLGVWFPSHRPSLMFVLSFFMFVGNMYVGKRGFPVNSAIFLWSISVEEQFYLVWPLLNRYCTRKSLAIIALLTFPLSAGTIVWLAKHHLVSNLSIWVNTIVLLQIFAWGVLISLALGGRLPQFKAIHRILLLIVGIGLWLIAAIWCPIANEEMPTMPAIITGYLLVGAGCAAMFLSVYGINKRRIPRVLVYLGKRSYGLYVFHDICLQFPEWLLNRIPATSSAHHHVIYGLGHVGLGFGLTLAVSVLSYKFFETPFLRLKERFTVLQSRSV